MIAALFVEPHGPYASCPDVDAWDSARDARRYGGPHPVVAHPPCERWGRYATGGPNPRARRRLIGDDDNCFLAAITAVRRFGGVVEHPAASLAWLRFGIIAPSHHYGWLDALDGFSGFTCYLEQGSYGHPARKPTWLYVAGVRRGSLPALRFGRAAGSFQRIEDGPRSKEHADAMRAERKATGIRAPVRLTRDERLFTPPAFRDALIDLAKRAAR